MAYDNEHKAAALAKARRVIIIRRQYEEAETGAERVRLARLLEAIDKGLQTA